MTPSARYDLYYMPYLMMSGTEEVRFGRARVFDFDKRASEIADSAVRQRVRAILDMNREQSRNAGQGRPLRHMGVVAVGQADCRVLSRGEQLAATRLRYALFLACLAENVRLHGPNAGSFAYTAENFDVVHQPFTLDSDYVGETSGVLVPITNVGYRITETQYPKPSWVNQPSRLRFDRRLLQQLNWLRATDRGSFRRILAAAAVFLESYRNAENVPIAARVLLQAAAFETLLALPDERPRLAFKDFIERLTNVDRLEIGLTEKRVRYKWWNREQWQWDVRSVKGMWADRFYMLRNAISHGDLVPRANFHFRRQQHHLAISPLMFMMCVWGLIDEVRKEKELPPVTTDFLLWRGATSAEGGEANEPGFRVERDFVKLFELAALDNMPLV